MAQIAEDLLLLLLDNASSRPALDRARRQRVLAAAVLLDLAYACRLRPAFDGEQVSAGRLLSLAGPDPRDPVLELALQVVQRRPTTPQAAVAKLRRGVEPALLQRLEQLGQIRPVRLRARRFRQEVMWPLADRSRVNRARAALLSVLFDGHCPPPPTAAIISLLHTVDGLGALLSLNDRGWHWVHARAGDVAAGCWINEGPVRMPEMNLAVTIAALRPTLT